MRRRLEQGNQPALAHGLDDSRSPSRCGTASLPGNSNSTGIRTAWLRHCGTAEPAFAPRRRVCVVSHMNGCHALRCRKNPKNFEDIDRLVATETAPACQ